MLWLHFLTAAAVWGPPGSEHHRGWVREAPTFTWVHPRLQLRPQPGPAIVPGPHLCSGKADTVATRFPGAVLTMLGCDSGALRNPLNHHEVA